MPMWHEDKELSKYNKYKAKNRLSENGTSSKCAHIAHSLTGVLLGGTALAHVHSRVPVLALRAF